MNKFQCLLVRQILYFKCKVATRVEINEMIDSAVQRCFIDFQKMKGAESALVRADFLLIQSWSFRKFFTLQTV